MATGTGVYVVASTPAAAGIFALPVIAAIVLCVAGLAFGRLAAVLWGAGIIAAVYVASLLYRAAPPDPWCPLVAAGLLVASEMGSWSIDSRRHGLDDLTVHAGRFRALALEITAALALVLVVQTASQFSGGGTITVALATAAVLVGAGAICVLIWRSAGAGAAPDAPGR